MFTGIVEARGTIRKIQRNRGLLRVTIEAPGMISTLRRGASVAVDGACFTVIHRQGKCFVIEAIAETQRKTTLGRLTMGDRVNLERPLKAQGRLDGHLVLGHVDGVGRVRQIQRRRDGWAMAVRYPARLKPLLIPKGSVAIDGVSLTIGRLTNQSLTVFLIPETIRRTTLALKRPGDLVNIEGDVIGKYVQRLMP